MRQRGGSIRRGGAPEPLFGAWGCEEQRGRAAARARVSARSKQRGRESVGGGEVRKRGSRMAGEVLSPGGHTAAACIAVPDRRWRAGHRAASLAGGRRRPEDVGWALVGFGWEGRRREMGQKRPSWFRNPSFLWNLL
jgi:hypothetical protein